MSVFKVSSLTNCEMQTSGIRSGGNQHGVNFSKGHIGCFIYFISTQIVSLLTSAISCYASDYSTCSELSDFQRRVLETCTDGRLGGR